MLYDPSLQDLIQETIEEYYRNYDECVDDLPNEELFNEDDCPAWIKEQLDDDIPF